MVFDYNAVERAVVQYRQAQLLAVTMIKEIASINGKYARDRFGISEMDLRALAGVEGHALTELGSIPRFMLHVDRRFGESPVSQGWKELQATLGGNRAAPVGAVTPLDMAINEYLRMQVTALEAMRAVAMNSAPMAKALFKLSDADISFLKNAAISALMTLGLGYLFLFNLTMQATDHPITETLALIRQSHRQIGEVAAMNYQKKEAMRKYR